MIDLIKPGALVIAAILTVRKGAVEAFRDYETKAAAIISRHGGTIERTVVEEVSDPEKPFREVHVLTFPDSEAFRSYRSDPDIRALAELRASAVAHTELILGRDGPDYMALAGIGSGPEPDGKSG